MLSKHHKQAGPRSTIKNRKRFINQKTNYNHRFKMLKNYEKIYRLLFLKKNAYSVAAVYETWDPGKPDKAMLYMESRYFQLKRNLSDSYSFGKLVGQNLNRLYATGALDSNRMLILDLKHHKKIDYSTFIKGVREVLGPNIKHKL